MIMTVATNDTGSLCDYTELTEWTSTSWTPRRKT